MSYVKVGVRIFRPIDSSPHGRFAPHYRHFVPWAIAHRRFAPWMWGETSIDPSPQKTLRLTRTLALFQLDAENRQGKRKKERRKKPQMQH